MCSCCKIYKLHIAHVALKKKNRPNIAATFLIRFVYLENALDLHDLNAYEARIKFNDPIQNPMETK